MKNKDPTDIWFVEGDKLFQFSHDEYCLITKLKDNYEGDIDIPDDDSLIQNYFPEVANPKLKRRGIKLKELKDAFVSCTAKQDKVRIGVAYLIKSFVLGNWLGKLIDLDTLQLVTDVNVFNEHP